MDEINAANNARQRLKRIHNYPKGYLKTIKDERAPKHPVSSFGFFTKAKYASGDMGPGPVSSHVTAISAAWKSLSAAERQVSTSSQYSPSPTGSACLTNHATNN